MTVPLNSLFHVGYGHKLDLNKMDLSPKQEGGINFVGRSSRNHGVSATIAKLEGIEPYPAGSITVALGGTKLLASFVQIEPFYTAQNVAVLQPKVQLSGAEKLFLCLCIRHNRFRYSAFGREANRTIRTLPVPSTSEFPAWLKTVSLDELDRTYSKPVVQSKAASLDPSGWPAFELSELFDIRKGRRLTQAAMKPGVTPFISAIDKNNGIRQLIEAEPTHPGGVITVNYNGSVAEAFYQSAPFVASDDVNILYPKFDMDASIALFICAIIRRERYRFSYGRKWNLDRMKVSPIRLPANTQGEPDWAYIREFIQKLPYSALISKQVTPDVVMA
jgi:hypothetical protein